MKNKQVFCKKCGAEITDSSSKHCSNCGAKISKPIFKKWWFWVLIALGLIIIGSVTSDVESGTDGSGVTNTETTTQSQQNDTQTDTTKYTVVDLQTMMDDLENNALKAESMYQNKYIEVKGKIANFDSDGYYISIEPVHADEWNFDTTMCYIKNDSQRNFLMNKSVGDIVTIRGKVISIGEIIGYSINIDEIY